MYYVFEQVELERNLIENTVSVLSTDKLVAVAEHVVQSIICIHAGEGQPVFNVVLQSPHREAKVDVRIQGSYPTLVAATEALVNAEKFNGRR